MKPSQPSYHSATSNAKTLTRSSLSFILSRFLGHFVGRQFFKPRAETSKLMTTPTKNGNQCFISQLAGDSLPSESLH
jgi:hypothetical protein